MEKLFAGWETPMVQACLQGRMGRVQTLGKDSALASIGDFCFLAGEPSPELLTAADAPILVPGSAGVPKSSRGPGSVQSPESMEGPEEREGTEPLPYMASPL